MKDRVLQTGARDGADPCIKFKTCRRRCRLTCDQTTQCGSLVRGAIRDSHETELREANLMLQPISMHPRLRWRTMYSLACAPISSAPGWLPAQSSDSTICGRPMVSGSARCGRRCPAWPRTVLSSRSASAAFACPRLRQATSWMWPWCARKWKDLPCAWLLRNADDLWEAQLSRAGENLAALQSRCEECFRGCLGSAASRISPRAHLRLQVAIAFASARPLERPVRPLPASVGKKPAAERAAVAHSQRDSSGRACKKGGQSGEASRGAYYRGDAAHRHGPIGARQKSKPACAEAEVAGGTAHL